MTRPDKALLGKDEPPPAVLFNADGGSPFLIVGDHAGNAIPRALGNLGLKTDDRVRHIAWDIGVRELGMALASTLGAMFIYQPYSRLVIDCNRDPAHPDAAPEAADGSRVPGNAGLTADGRAARVTAIHAPYHDRIAQEIARRSEVAQPTILLALHSFTPTLGGRHRPWQVGILHDAGETYFAKALLVALSEHNDLTVGDNEPYRMDATDYTVPHHAYRQTLPYAEIEIRQDLLTQPADIARWSQLIGGACETAIHSQTGRL